MAEDTHGGPLAPPAGHLQFPQFDALRALAAISILLVHVTIFSGSLSNGVYGRFVAHLDIGVPFFFLLSAFLLYRPYVQARVQGTGATPLGTYARRRFLRIVPAYWLVLTVAAIVPGVAGAFSGNWWVYYGLLQNYPVYTADATCTFDPYRCGIPVAWSLAIEVAFYALLPLFALMMSSLVARLGGRNWLRIELLVILLLCAISVVIQSSVPIGEAHVWLFFSPLGRGWWFGLGLALAVISVWVQGRAVRPRAVELLRRWPLAAPAAGLALFVIACTTFLEPTPSLAFPVTGQVEYVAEYLLFGLIAALVMLPAIFDRSGGGIWGRLLRTRLLTWLGLVSYGIFLWQFPVLLFLVDEVDILELAPSNAFPLLAITTFVGTVACAALSYYLLERPLMALGRARWERGRVASASRASQPSR